VFVVDTNLLLYAANRDAPEYALCHNLLRDCQRQASPWHITWGIVYEFLRVATHRSVFRRPLSQLDAWKFIETSLASPGLSVLIETPRHRAVAVEVFGSLPEIAGSLVFDAHTAILMKEHGVKKIYTRDSDFRRFPFLEVVNPIAEARG
jgi:uncharacterized protein